ncbi:MAG: NACHT domain-containing protein [Lewinellaceae bacterium]|nr:NACHT domain-containing protein [Lewinellaceae bacterium]
MTNLSGIQKLLLYLIIIFGSILVLSLVSDNTIGTIIASILIAIILLIAKPLWLTYSDNRVRVFSLYVVLAVALSFHFWQPYIDVLTAKVLGHFFPELDLSNSPLYDNSPGLVLGFVLIAVWIVNNSMQQNRILSSVKEPLEADFPNIPIKEKLKNIAGAVSTSIDIIDNKSNWSSGHFTPLEAEVELIREKGGKERKIVNVLEGIKSSRDQTILLLGEPGSGKSVTLRKLCKEIALESEKTGRIPLYINLKEWKTNWSADDHPYTQHLFQFIRDYITENFNFIIGNFLYSEADKRSTVFEKLYESGRLYFIFDSFDEIPAIISADDGSDIIRQLSEVIFKFLKIGKSSQAQGVVASRLYKRPSKEFITNTILEIRPFSDQKIFRTLETQGFYSVDKIKEIFATRPDLVSVIRNPFMASLLASYSKSNRDSFPLSKKQLFDDFISNAINEKLALPKYKGIDYAHTFSFAVDLSDIMFNKVEELEVSLGDVNRYLKRYHVDNILELLFETRIIRGITREEGGKVSFVHRRFAEYFIINKDNNYDLQSITNLGKWHDALVLYSEIAEPEEAEKIAAYAWNKVKEAENILDIGFINPYRFLIEAFSFRKEPLRAFKAELDHFILNTIDKTRNLLELKVMIEGIGLLDNKDIDASVAKIMGYNNQWLNETAIRSSRHLPKISAELEKSILSYISEMGILDFVKKFNAIKFSFSLNPVFRKGVDVIKVKLFEIVLFALLILVLFYYFSISGDFHLQFGILIGILVIYFIFKGNFSMDELKSTMGLVFIGLFISEFAKNGWTHMSTCPEPHFQVLFILGIAIIPILKFSISFIFLKSKITLNDLAIVLIFFAISMGYFLYARWIGNSILMPDYIRILIPLSFVAGYVIIYLYNPLDYLKYKKINFKRCNERPYIYETIASFRSRYFVNKFLNYLEFNVDQAIGEWPDPELFNNTRNETVTRLAALEEKWLGINK